MLYSAYEWQLDSSKLVREIDDISGINPIVLQLLKNRGIVGADQVKRFLNPVMDFLYDPMLLKDMDKAVARIKSALFGKEKITVYGDYDADGITSTCILIKLLKSLEANVDYYIPSRLEEGYGLNKKAIKKIYQQDTRLLITVDNGISSYEEVEFAKQLGIDVIITDHHEPGDLIPKAVAVVNPKQEDCEYPFKDLAGVGVAFKLAQALTKMDPKMLQEFVELTALGTIADIVPLLDENRVIAKNGLKYMQKTSNKGILAMFSNLKLDQTSIDSGKIAYIIAPRINAAGRMGKADAALELLLTEDEAYAFELANILEKVNQERQSTEQKIFNEAKKIIEEDVDLEKNKVIVLSNSNWHPGVIGIVASKLVDIYHRPCILITKEDEKTGKGSGRSIPGFNLYESLTHFSEMLLSYGGHEQAVGLSIKFDDIEEFRDKINTYAAEILKSEEIIPRLNIDLELNEQDITLDLAEQLELMEPFGYGNPKPVFVCKNLSLNSIRTVGNQNKHLKMSFNYKGNQIEAIGFNFGSYIKQLNSAQFLDIVFNLEVNCWRGSKEPQFNIIDLKVPYIIDDLFCRLEEGYYKRFYDFNFPDIKAIHDITSIKKTQNSNITFKNVSEQERSKLIQDLLEKDDRTLVIVNTPYQAWRLAVLINKTENIKENTGIYYDVDCLYDIDKKNVILVNPLANILKVEFDKIIFYDPPFSIKFFEWQIQNVPLNSRIYVIFEKEDICYNKLVCERILPDIDGIRAIYVLLSKITAGKFVCQLNINKFTKIVQNFLNQDLHYVGLINVLKIFKEMGIIDFTINSGTINITKYFKPDKKLKLEYSSTYVKLTSVKNKVIEFNNKLSSKNFYLKLS